MKAVWIATSVCLMLAGCSKPAVDSGSSASSAPDSSAPIPASVATADNTPASGMPSANPASSEATQGAQLTDQNFVQNAALSDMFEIASSKLALKQSHNPAILSFARMMVSDHTKTTAALKAAIAKSGEQLSLPNALPADKQSQLQDLGAAGGADFDKKYMDAQVNGHQSALDLMSLYGNDGANPTLKAAAQKTGRLVQTHLDKAKSVRQTLG